MSGNTAQSGPQLPPDVEQAESELLRENLRRSYKERFLMATQLYKLQQIMKRPASTHKPGSHQGLKPGFSHNHKPHAGQ